MVTVPQDRPGAAPRRARVAGCTTAGAIAIVLSSHGSATGASPVDHLPSELLTALRLFPVDRSGSPSCLSIDGLRNRLAFPLTFGDRQAAVRNSDAYSPSTEGAYLGDGPVGAPAPPFVQALIDAGAAARVRLTWVRRVRTPTLSVPSLQDTGTGRAMPAQNPPPARCRPFGGNRLACWSGWRSGDYTRGGVAGRGARAVPCAAQDWTCGGAGASRRGVDAAGWGAGDGMAEGSGSRRGRIT